MRTLGILLAYAPGVQLTREGLGRYLTAFVRSAIKSRQVVIAVPSWSREATRELFENAGVDMARVTIIGPDRQPLILRLFNASQSVRRWRRRPRKPRPRRAREDSFVLRHLKAIASRLSATRNILELVLLTLYLGLLALGGAVSLIPGLVVRWIKGKSQKLNLALAARAARFEAMRARFAELRGIAIRRLYEEMHRKEIGLISRSANATTSVHAWYIPTAFWPTGAQLKRPALVCVPDVVISEFPLYFSEIPRVLNILETIEEVLAEGTDLVAYSERTKERVLIERHGIRPERINVVRHAPMTLSRHVDVSGYANPIAARNERAMSLLRSAMTRSVLALPAMNSDFKFIFFPTQFRPSKNIMTLLRAYAHLRSVHLFGHKLVLTGDPWAYPGLMTFVIDQRLELDVLFLKDLTDAELAGCYKLSDLAINTSISEGGMPFTFSEALSVGTPVIMSDIEVTREIIVDPDLAAATLFDPYDWRALAEKIEWAIAHREDLLETQLRFYEQVLTKRTWDDVVAEHLVLLDQLAGRQMAL